MQRVFRAKRTNLHEKYDYPGGQLFHTVLTLMAALAAELDVGLVALTRRTPSGGGRLLMLQSSRC